MKDNVKFQNRTMIFFFCYLIICRNVFPQIELQGVVRNNGAEVVEGALVELLDQQDTSRVFNCITDIQGRYSILLTGIDADNSSDTKPNSFHLHQNYPNPFNPTTIIEYELPRPTQVRIEIYNILGQKIKTLIDAYQTNLYSRVVWDATTDQGRGVSAGVYIYSLITDDYRINRKMLLLDGQRNTLIPPVTINRASSTGRNVLLKQVSNQFILRVSGADIEPYEQRNLVVTGNTTLDITVIRTVTDIDGNVYRTVMIGGQWWMAENMKARHYNNGSQVLCITDNKTWKNLTGGAYCFYNNDSTYVNDYGLLYNFGAVHHTRFELAPVGWHIATENDWKQLEMQLGMDWNVVTQYGWRGAESGGKLKEPGTEHWTSPNNGATNATGFTARPGGYRTFEGNFEELGNKACFWVATNTSNLEEPVRELAYDKTEINRTSDYKQCGLSVRCVRDNSIPNIPNLSSPTNNAVEILNVTTLKWDKSIGASTYELQVATDSVFSNIFLSMEGITTTSYQISELTDATTYYWHVKAVNNFGNSAWSDSFHFTTVDLYSNKLIDIDGNVYWIVKIGGQWWMAENLKVKHYRNGKAIPHVTDSNYWRNLTEGAYCYYNNDSTLVSDYGLLYNYYAVQPNSEIAPYGWHIPTDQDWKQLELNLGMSWNDIDLMSWRGVDEGGKLKETGIIHWNSPNTGANNESGFSAIPGGFCEQFGTFNFLGEYAGFWTSTQFNSNLAYNRTLTYSNSEICRNNDSKKNGFSIRCVRDICAPTAPTLISPLQNTINVITSPTLQWNYSNQADIYNIQVTSDSLFSKIDIEYNNISATSIKINGLLGSTTYYWRVNASNKYGASPWSSPWSFTTFILESGTVKDIEGNVYKTVKIGEQWWMAENLKVTHYRNWDAIPNVEKDSEWGNLTTGARASWDRYASYVSTYGYLYNWWAVNDIRDIAPAGWHVPTKAEWQTMFDYLGGNDVAGPKLREAGTIHWENDNSNVTNETGFTALPGGRRCDNGSYFPMEGYCCFIWTANETNSEKAINQFIFGNGTIRTESYSKKDGCSIRCVKDGDNMPVLQYLDISPDTSTIYNSTYQQYYCKAIFSDSSKREATALTLWSTSPGLAGEINSEGLFTSYPYKTGIETITATFRGHTATAEVRVEGHETGTVTDIDGNTYYTVKIGSQWWMAENLKVEHYCNGDSISENNSWWEWNELTSGAWCNYYENHTYKSIYGHLYNWYAINDERKLVPDGWHIPSEQEWQVLIDYLGGSEIAGGKLKEIGSSHWETPNSGATNISGFYALPGGWRDNYCQNWHTGAYFWSNTKTDSVTAIYIDLQNISHAVNVSYEVINNGLSIRCVKD